MKSLTAGDRPFRNYGGQRADAPEQIGAVHSGTVQALEDDVVCNWRRRSFWAEFFCFELMFINAWCRNRLEAFFAFLCKLEISFDTLVGMPLHCVKPTKLYILETPCLDRRAHAGAGAHCSHFPGAPT